MLSGLRKIWDTWLRINNKVATFLVPGLLIPFLVVIPGASALAEPGNNPWWDISSFWRALGNGEAWVKGAEVWKEAAVYSWNTSHSATAPVLSSAFAAASAGSLLPLGGIVAGVGLTAVFGYYAYHIAEDLFTPREAEPALAA